MYKTRTIPISEHIRLRRKETSVESIRFADTLAGIILERKELFNSLSDEVAVHKETDTFNNLKRINRI